ncbi:MAG: ComF family protein [Firmicutes bacterium]|nr:ComF family protein [Bacillota bacterium]
MNLKSTIKSVASTASLMLYPQHVTCLACGAELDGTSGEDLCAECTLDYIKTCCRACGRKIENLAELCDQCIEHEPYRFDLARSAVVFDEVSNKLIYGFKYGGAKYLTEYLASFLAEVVQSNSLSAADIITYVPLHKRRQRKRGYNQSELLGKALSKSIGIPCEGLLKKTRHTKNLAKLNRAQRGEIIHGTFEPVCERGTLKDKTVLLVDDVLTTGATADECARVLKRAGAKTVWVVTFASVQIKVQ